MFILIYLVIGLVIALINNHLYTKLLLKEQMIDDSSMIIAMILWTIFWPLSIINMIKMTIQLS